MMEYLTEYQQLSWETMRPDDPDLPLEQKVMVMASFALDSVVSDLVEILEILGGIPNDKMYFSVMGLVGETGEFIDLMKKFIYHKQDISRDRVSDEAGDVLWYTAAVATLCDLRMGELSDQSNNPVADCLREVVSHISVIIGNFGLTVEDVARNNVQKLHQERYPNGFVFGGGNDRQ